MYGEGVTFSGLPGELRRRRHLLVLVVGLIVLLSVGIVAMLVLFPAKRPAAAQPAPGYDAIGGAPLPEPAGAGGGEQSGAGGGEPTGNGQSGDQTGGTGDGSGDQGGDEPSAPSDPCANAQRALVGAPDPVNLQPGATKGSFTIHNCTDEAVPWMAATKPSVTLGHESGTLDPGATYELFFTVDTSAFDTQHFTFKIKVYGTTTNYFYVDVKGSKPVM